MNQQKSFPPAQTWGGDWLETNMEFKKSTQLSIIKGHLMEEGFVSRNWCLNRRITRLASRVRDLRDSGWNIQGEVVKTEHGKDYVYRLIID